ncbi:MAG TPA: MCP four helix bundle domain-containing protein, partial [Gallionella sp.]|nr:MCP four helix bundle domain-containing protein [Gallionella sp.]
MTNMKVGTRLGLSFGAVTLLIIIVVLMAWFRLEAIESRWQDFGKVTLMKKSAIMDGYINLGNGVHHFKNYILRGGDYNTKFMQDMDALDKIEQAYQATGVVSAEEQKLIQVIKEGTQDYRNGMNQLVKLKASGADMTQLDKAVAGADKALAAALSQFFKLTEDNVQAETEGISALVVLTQEIMGVSGVLAIILSIILAMLITR